MNAATREFFDGHLEHVLKQLPEQVHRLLDEVPLIVDDHPSRETMRRMGVRNRRQLCGLYTGIPLGSRSVEHSGVPSDVVHIFREGIVAMARDESGAVDPEELRRQIAITILHELGHHHGLSEEELEELGY
ncbi:MAG: metallopeptidase family protein [Planctomycetes bacterium]|nr:metallopeptidase family protein [Planctomycetota bacterium]